MKSIICLVVMTLGVVSCATTEQVDQLSRSVDQRKTDLDRRIEGLATKQELQSLTTELAGYKSSNDELLVKVAKLEQAVQDARLQADDQLRDFISRWVELAVSSHSAWTITLIDPDRDALNGILEPLGDIVPASLEDVVFECRGALSSPTAEATGSSGLPTYLALSRTRRVNFMLDVERNADGGPWSIEVYVAPSEEGGTRRRLGLLRLDPSQFESPFRFGATLALHGVEQPTRVRIAAIPVSSR